MAAESQRPGLGGIAPAGARGEIAPEPPEVTARGLALGARLLCGASTFFFLAFFFAYFYLRSLNQEHMWRPHHVKPEQGLGAAFIACVVISALLAIVASRRMRARSGGWTGAALVAVLLGLAAVALQCIAYTRQPFGPTDGAYASVYVGWTAFYMIAVLGAMYWLETHIATEFRARRAPASANGPGGAGDIKDPDQLIAPGLDAAAFYWAFLAGLGVVMYVTLYLL
jgi:heme/copper-type cytochrome/quinol oxidase subunit 3